MHHNRSEVIHLELIKLLISHDRESQQIENFTGMLFHDQDLSKYTAKLGPYDLDCARRWLGEGAGVGGAWGR